MTVLNWDDTRFVVLGAVTKQWLMDVHSTGQRGETWFASNMLEIDPYSPEIVLPCWAQAPSVRWLEALHILEHLRETSHVLHREV